MARPKMALWLLILLTACSPAGSRETPLIVSPVQSAIPSATPSATPEPTRTAIPSPTLTCAPTATMPPTPAMPADGLSMQAASMRPAYAQEVFGLQDATRYTIELVVHFDPAKSRADMEGVARIRYTNQTRHAISQIPLMLWPNHEQYRSRMLVENVMVDGEILSPRLDAGGIVLWIELAEKLPSGGRLDLSVPFRIVDIGSMEGGVSHRFGITHGELLAPTSYPLVPRIVEGQWQVEPAPLAGDTTNSEVAFYDLRLTAPEGLVLVASGTEVERQIDGEGHQIVRLISGPMRDFAFALGPFENAHREVDGVSLQIWYLPQHAEDARRVSIAGATQLTLLSQLVGQYPYLELDLVDAPGAFGGIEYPGLVYIGTLGTNWVIDPVIHEVAHQWFYGLIGSDQLAEPWLDEALASYAQVLYYEYAMNPGRATALLDFFRGIVDLQSDPTIPIGLPVSAYGSQEEYAVFVYQKGALFIDALRNRMGDEAFLRLLRDYFQAYRYGFAEAGDFQAEAEVACECNLDQLFDQWVYQGGQIPGP